MPGGNHRERAQVIESGQVWHFGKSWHLERKGLRPIREHLHIAGVVLPNCDLDVLRAAVAPDRKIRTAAGWDFVNHAAKLLRSLDALAVEFKHHVIFFQASLGRGAVRNNLSK